MIHRLPATQRPFTAKDVKIAHAMMLVRAEIEHVMGFVVKRGHFFTFCIDCRSKIHRLLIMTVLDNRVPNVRFSITARTIRNEIENLIIRKLHQARLHRGTTFLIDNGRQLHRLPPDTLLLFRMPQRTLEVSFAHTHATSQNHPLTILTETEITVEILGMVNGQRQRFRPGIASVIQHFALVKITVPVGFEKMFCILSRIIPHSREQKCGVRHQLAGKFRKGAINCIRQGFDSHYNRVVSGHNSHITDLRPCGNPQEHQHGDYQNLYYMPITLHSTDTESLNC